MREQIRWSAILSDVADFGQALGVSVATRDKRTGEWSGVGLMVTSVADHGRIKLAWRDEHGASVPFGGLTDHIALSALPTIGRIVQARDALIAAHPAPVAPIPSAVADAQAFIRAHKRDVCPTCHRKYDGAMLSCQCPPVEDVDLGPQSLIDQIAENQAKIDTLIRNALGTARVEPFERRDFKQAQQLAVASKTALGKIEFVTTNAVAA